MKQVIWLEKRATTRTIEIGTDEFNKQLVKSVRCPICVVCSRGELTITPVYSKDSPSTINLKENCVKGVIIKNKTMAINIDVPAKFKVFI